MQREIGPSLALSTVRVPGVSVQQPRLLIVDDDAESRELLCEFLGANGYAVEAAADGKAAREALTHESAYRIVIADLRMPEESGIDLLRNLRRQNLRHDIILMSSFISGTERQIAKELGAHALLEKPFRLSALLEVVAELAARNPIGISS